MSVRIVSAFHPLLTGRTLRHCRLHWCMHLIYNLIYKVREQVNLFLFLASSTAQVCREVSSSSGMAAF